MADQVISIAYGHETFDTRSVRLSAFAVSAPFVRALPSKVLTRQGVVQRFPASRFPDVNGTLYIDSVRVPDNTVVIVQCSRKWRASPEADGAVVIVARSTAPLYAISAMLPEHKDALQSGQFLAFQGRGDIIQADDFEVLETLGIEIPERWASAFMDEEEVAECYRIVTIAPESEARPELTKIETAKGEVVVTAKAPGRRVRFR